MPPVISYLIVGSGYRSEYFGRVAATYPDLFRAMFLCRSEQKADLVQAHTGIAATVSTDEALAFRPDFVVVAVDRGHVADVAEEWVRRGFAVVTETPVADTREKLDRIWELSRQGAKIVCCEQYCRQPLLYQGLKALREGKIGTPSSMYISLLHDYHAASLIWQALRVRPGEPFRLAGVRQVNPVTETDSRQGAILDGRVKETCRDLFRVSFEGGREALYDFNSIQYRSYIRSRHLTVRGDRGEWSDTVVSWVDENNEPRRLYLLPELEEKYRILDTQALRDRRRNWQFELAPDTVQDEFAIASLLLDMREYLAGGPSPYPIEQALDDGVFWRAVEEGARRPGKEICVDRRPWAV